MGRSSLITELSDNDRACPGYKPAAIEVLATSNEAEHPHGAIETLSAWNDGDLDLNDVLKAMALTALRVHRRSHR